MVVVVEVRAEVGRFANAWVAVVDDLATGAAVQLLVPAK